MHEVLVSEKLREESEKQMKTSENFKEPKQWK